MYPGCNFLGAEVEIVDGLLLADSLSTTEMGCAPEAHAADEWLAELLEARPEISRDGDTLTSTGGGSTVVLTLSSDDARPPDEVGPSLIGETVAPDESVAYTEELQVLADEPTMPDEDQMAPVGLATTAEQQQQAQWDRLNRGHRPVAWPAENHR